MAKQDGGPAFPRPLGAISPEEFNSDQVGMSLRDWFAGLAMAGLVQDLASQRILRDRCKSTTELHQRMAEVTYLLADAMLDAKRATRSQA